ncbi:MAG: 50S ribosomal protein L15 [Bdellovibrionota bacterium]
MKLHDLHPAPGAKTKRKRVGRGPGSGHGKTSTRGHKGLGQHGGRGQKRHYEGGQNPFTRRLPKRGFTSMNRPVVQIVNVVLLRRFAAGAVVDREALYVAGAIAHAAHPVKVLGQGKLDVALKVKVDRISDSARKKIEQAGGSVEIVAAPPAAGTEKKA